MKINFLMIKFLEEQKEREKRGGHFSLAVYICHA
jgi:hypothetical protein